MTFPIAIILVAHRADRWLPACIASLRASLEYPIRLVLVDNGGNTCIDSLDLTGFDAMVLRCERPMGFAEANNFALLNGSLDSEFVCFLNQDTISREDWLSACIGVLRADESIGAVMPLIENYEATAWDEAFLTCCRATPALHERLSRGVFARTDDFPPFMEIPEITAAAMVVRTEALLKAGPFDPIYGSYYEDYDLCRRIAQAGYKVGICTRGRVGHFGGSVTTDRRTYARRARWIARNRVIYAARWKWRNRTWGLATYAAWEMPWRTARSLLGRSQIPLRSLLLAQLDLLRLGRRLASANYDRRCWSDYLRTVGWPNVSGGAPSELAAKLT